MAARFFSRPSLCLQALEGFWATLPEISWDGNLVPQHHQNTESGPINALWPTPMPNACFTRRRMAAPSSWSTRAPGGSRLCPVWWAELVRSTCSETCLTGKPEFGRMVMWMAVVFSSNLGQFHMFSHFSAIFSHFQLQEVCAPLRGSGQAPWGYRALVALGAMAWTWVTWMIFQVISQLMSFLLQVRIVPSPGWMADSPRTAALRGKRWRFKPKRWPGPRKRRVKGAGADCWPFFGGGCLHFGFINEQRL